MQRYLVINGPNLDRLGHRQPEIYGSITLDQLERDLKKFAAGLSVEVATYQSNLEPDLIEAVKSAEADFDGVILNPAAFTHYSRALGDAVSAISKPVVEVHISNILEREPWRRRSVIGHAHRIYGRGTNGYRWAIRHLLNRAAWPSKRLGYGPLPDQFGDLRSVDGALALVVVIHGGLWRHEWTADTAETIAIDLCRRGYSTFNLEYRRLGLGGGWPESFSDIATALARIPELTGFSADQTVLLGHSAGATMALWVEHSGLSVAMAPFTDLVGARSQMIAGDTFPRLLVEPLPDPREYSPAHRLPRAGSVVVAASPIDRLVPITPVSVYVEEAQRSGVGMDLILTDGGHFDFLEPSSTSWGLIAEALEARKPPL